LKPLEACFHRSIAICINPKSIIRSRWTYLWSFLNSIHDIFRSYFHWKSNHQSFNL